MSVLYYVNLEQLYLKDMLAFVVYKNLLHSLGLVYKSMRGMVTFIAEFFEENFESRENNAQILKNVNRHIYLCKQLNKTTFSLWLLSIRI
jgi:hypothetical protein